MEFLTAALDAMRQGLISPFAFVALLLLGLIVWLAAKFGDRWLSSIGGLLDAGEKVRQSLAAQVIASDQRALTFQQLADGAGARILLLQSDLNALTIRHEAMQARCARQAEDLAAALEQVQDLRLRLSGRLPGERA